MNAIPDEGERPRIFSAIQPSGTLTLGNYLGAVRSWVRLQSPRRGRSGSSASPTTTPSRSRHEPQALPSLTLELTLDLLACGLDPGRSVLSSLELAREIARRFNQRFGWTFPEPAPILNRSARILSLADPGQKMSKSLGARHYLGLFEEETTIRAKIRAAVTDSGGAGGAISSGIENLFRILAETAPREEHERFDRARRAGALRYAELKEAVADHVLAALRPLRERRATLTPAFARRVLNEGTARSRDVARATASESCASGVRTPSADERRGAACQLARLSRRALGFQGWSA